MTLHLPLAFRTSSIATAAWILAAWPTAGSASDIADALKKLTAQTVSVREVTLKDIGIREPIVLDTADARRELFLPVPAGVAISEASLQLDARYLRDGDRRATLVLSLDGYPVSSRSFTQPEGNAGIELGVDGSPRPSGFVRLGAAWSSAASERACNSERTGGNILEIAPTTRLRYRYDAGAVHDLASAWTALPSSVTILVAGKAVAKDAYDAAWRLGVALERAGKKVAAKAFPSLGDEVDSSTLSIPEPLLSIPAFAGLKGTGRRKLQDAAEIGALLVLGAAPVQAHLAVADPELRSRMQAALAALVQQMDAAAPDAKAVLAEWRTGVMTLADAPLEANAVRLTRMAGQPLIAVAPDAGAKAAGLFADALRRIAVTKSVVIESVQDTRDGSSTVSLARLGGTATSFDVMERGDWSATFDLGALASDGQVPARLEFDVAAAPGATSTPPVATVFLNDRLLGAKRLDANGQPERIEAGVPAYALKPRNVLRVSFQRQVAGEHCREAPQAFPVAVLPTSRLILEKASPSDDFTGVVPRLAGNATLIVPDAWLANAPESLASAIRLADASGLSPLRASFATASGSASAKPGGPFLALDVSVEGAAERVKVDGKRLMVAGRDSGSLIDVGGLEDLGALGVVRAGTHPGLIYRPIGTRFASLSTPFLLSEGDVAVLGPEGVLARIDTRDPTGTQLVGDGRKTRMETLWSNAAWGGSAAAAVSFLVLLLRARHVRRRKSSADS